jgi:hypothetical protein
MSEKENLVPTASRKRPREQSDDDQANDDTRPLRTAQSAQHVSIPIATLTTAQQNAVDAVLQGHNVYIGGVSGERAIPFFFFFLPLLIGGRIYKGSGKSMVIHAIRSKIQHSTRKSVAVLAFTGLAASLIQGSTIHSFMGITVPIESTTSDTAVWSSVRKNRVACHRLAHTHVFIFDELSYISRQHYAIYEYLVRRSRSLATRGNKPWGGAQIVFLGDFKQLPPIGSYDRDQTPWLFLSPSWRSHITHYFHLSTVIRQRDPMLVAALADIRQGTVSIDTDQFFRRLAEQPPLECPTAHLFSTVAAVDAHNEQEMARLPYEVTTYIAKTVQKDPTRVPNSTFAAPEELSLKRGATVMLIKNLEDGLVNGTLGVVLGFCTQATWRERQEEEVEESSLMDCGGTQLDVKSRSIPLPVVQWTPPGASSPLPPALVKPYTFKMADQDGTLIVSRTQVSRPLSLFSSADLFFFF